MKRILLLSLSLLPLAACGGSADAASTKDEAYKAMDSGDSEAALAKFDQLLGGMEASAPDYLEVSVARCEALAGVDGEKAKAEFMALAEKHELKVGDYTSVASKLQQNKQYVPAIDILDAAVHKFPEDKDKIVAKIDQLAKKASADGDDEATSALQGLGYLGGDD